MTALSPPELLAHAQAHLSAYLQRFPAERGELEALLAQFEDGDANLLARANMRGHITTSGIVFDAAAQKVLMIHHKVLDRWLQPGGHHEGGDPLDRSAAREVAEETGVSGLAPLRWLGNAAHEPFDVETHPIRANSAKGEGSHWHHDFVYLFSADSSRSLQPQWAEVKGATWMDLADFEALPVARFSRIAGKLRALGAIPSA